MSKCEILSCAVLSNELLYQQTYLLWLNAPALALAASPGQFCMLRCDSGLKRLLRRPLSIHQVEGGRVAFLYRLMGQGTQWLADRKKGEEVDMLGPLGNGFAVEPQTKRLLLVAGGIGFAPLRFLAEKALAEGREVTLLLGAKTASHLYPRQLLPKGARLMVATEDGSEGSKGLVTPLAIKYGGQADRAFACGPEPMYRALVGERTALPRGLRVQVSLEVRLGCGIGACLSCSIKTRGGQRHVCKDGPVFDMDEVVWGETPVCAL